MSKITDALLKAQYLLKDKANVSDILVDLSIIGKYADGLDDATLSPEVEAALETINNIFKKNVS